MDAVRVGSGARSARAVTVVAWPLAALVAVVAVVALPACSSAGDGGQARLPTASSGTSAVAQVVPTSGTSSSPEAASTGGAAASPAPGTALGSALAVRITAAVKAKKTATVTLNQTAQGATNRGSGVVRYTDSGTELSLRMVQDGQTTRVVLVKGALYVAGPKKVAGKTWIAVPADGGSVIAGLLRSVQQSASYEQTTRTLGLVTVTDGGRATVNGVNVTEYSWSMTDSQILAALPEGEPAAVRTALKGAKGATTLYLDANDLPVLVTSSVTVKGVTSRSTIAYRDWGGSVSIAAPAAKDTTPLPTA